MAACLPDAVGPRVTGHDRGDVVIRPVPEPILEDDRILLKRIVAVAGRRVTTEPGATSPVSATRCLLDDEDVERMGVTGDPGNRAPATMVDADGLHEHGPMLLAAARFITLDHAEAEDLVQTTFEIAIRRLGDLRDPVALRAWLLRIQAREAFRVIRRLRRFVSLEGRVAEVADPGPDIARSADVRAALARLPRRTRAAIALHHVAGLSVAETAAALGVSENTVKTQLRTGLARLREDLA